MILYHGSNVEASEPRLLRIQRDLDFGKGFYTTSDLGQAESWAKRVFRIRGTGRPLVSCYEVGEAAIDALNVLRFEKPDRSWLDYVAANRRDEQLPEEWDLVIGPVANDQTFPTLLLYLDGYWRYHQEAIQNAYADIDSLLATGKHIQPPTPST